MRPLRVVSYVLGALLFASLLIPLRASKTESAAELINRRNTEVSFLHLPIDRVVLGSLRVWDEKTENLRLRAPGEAFDDQRPILILHLWATWCGPCKDEFEVWRDLKDRMHRQFGNDVSIVHVALQSDTSAMASFVKQQGDKMPTGPKYFDRDERLANVLRVAFKGKDLPTLPVTLWLGPARTVRQALIGSISNRTTEVMDSTARLLRNLKYLRENAKLVPKDEEWDTFTKTAPCACPCICN